MNAAVLVVGSGHREFRQYALEGLARTCDALLLNSGTVTWQRPFLVDAQQVNFDDHAEVIAAATSLAARHRVRGILTWNERLILLTAEIAAALGVHSLPVAAARACRDKARQRAAFARAGVPSARYQLAGSAAEAQRAAAELGYPVVVKPRSRAASVGVQVVFGEGELDGAVARARKSEDDTVTDGGVLIEEFLRGYEVSVDSWVLGGEVRPFAVALKRIGFAPFFEEIGHIVGSVLDSDIEHAVHDTVARANRALGVERCVTHTELMITESGPRIIEVNGRLGGDLIPYLGELARPGLSIGEVIASVACGVRPREVGPAEQVVGIHFVYPEQDLIFERLEVPPALRRQEWVHEIRQLRKAGDALRLPPRAFLSRAGYGVVLGEDVATVGERLGLLAREVTAVGRTLHSDEYV